VDLITIDPPFNSNRNYEGPGRTGIIWGETKEKRSFEDRHESTKAYIDSKRARCVERARVRRQNSTPPKTAAKIKLGKAEPIIIFAQQKLGTTQPYPTYEHHIPHQNQCH
jgi:hypothetical protein